MYAECLTQWTPLDDRHDFRVRYTPRRSSSTALFRNYAHPSGSFLRSLSMAEVPRVRSSCRVITAWPHLLILYSHSTLVRSGDDGHAVRSWYARGGQGYHLAAPVTGRRSPRPGAGRSAQPNGWGRAGGGPVAAHPGPSRQARSALAGPPLAQRQRSNRRGAPVDPIASVVVHSPRLHQDRARVELPRTPSRRHRLFLTENHARRVVNYYI
jgi:hypothetical protein